MANRIIVRPKKSVPFPVYDQVVAQIERNNVTQPNPKAWSQMSKLDLNNTRLIFFMIVHHARLHGNKDEIPYARKVPEGGKGVIYDVDSLPPDLRIILSECINTITS